MNPKVKNRLQRVIKISISLLLIFYVFTKIDWKQVTVLLQNSEPIYLFFAIVSFALSIGISVLRFDLFIKNAGIRLDLKNNTRLYLLGMFYNFFIPGGVGGDAYKTYLLSKSFDKSLKRIGKLVFVERFLGLIAIGFILSILSLFIKTPFTYLINLGIFISACLVTFFVLKLLNKWVNAHKKRIYIGFLYSILIQSAQIISLIFILKSFQVLDDYLAYIFIFLVSSILSVFSFAGIGIREATFYFGASFFAFNPEISVSIALIFSLITAMISSFGMLYSFKIIRIQLKN